MLEPISPAEAKQRFLNHSESKYSSNTLREYGYSLQRFVEWCDENRISNMNKVTSRTVADFADDRGENVKVATLKTDLDRVRVFIRYCESIEGVAEGVANKILTPDLSEDEETRSERLHEQDAEAVLDYLDTFEYASLKHAIMELMWHTQLRRGGLRGIDVGDIEYDHGSPYIIVAHRPKTGTPLKNKYNGEREIAISKNVHEVLQDYIEYHRKETTDDHGRAPLFTSREGRLGKTAFQRICYGFTRPCIYAKECPHDRDPETCEANTYNTASKCPSSRSPHAIRRGAIQKALNNGASKDNVSSRCNTSTEVLDKHYDTDKQAELRRRRSRDLDKY